MFTKTSQSSNLSTKVSNTLKWICEKREEEQTNVPSDTIHEESSPHLIVFMLTDNCKHCWKCQISILVNFTICGLLVALISLKSCCLVKERKQKLRQKPYSLSSSVSWKRQHWDLMGEIFERKSPTLQRHFSHAFETLSPILYNEL